MLELIGRNAVRIEFPKHLSSMHDVSVSVIKPYRQRVGVDPGVHVEGEVEFQIDRICDHHLLQSRTFPLLGSSECVGWTMLRIHSMCLLTLNMLKMSSLHISRNCPSTRGLLCSELVILCHCII